jgi:nitrite reductase/ring-hydroxylating ferredoxin subunit
MPAIMAARRERDFMSTKSKKSFTVPKILLVLLSVTVLACEPDLRDSDIPPPQFEDIYINLTLPQYNAVRTDGGSMFIDGGVRGIILYRASASQYVAYEVNCSYQPDQACATVNVHASRLYMEDPCCSSTFSFTNGEPMGGPAWRPLRRYYTQLNGTQLLITSEIL